MTSIGLDDKRKAMLRAASIGYIDQCVDETWNAVGDGVRIFYIHGFPQAKELAMIWDDLRYFEKLGFMKEISRRRGTAQYYVDMDMIHEAVQNEFETSTRENVGRVDQTIHIGKIIDSNLNIALNQENVAQNINASSSLPDEVKARLKKEVETLYSELEATQKSHPQESQAIEKHVRRLVEDVSESKPDKDGVTNSLSLLERASKALASFAGIVTSIDKIRDIVSSLPFMQ